jgi:hypothetical protein
LEEKNSGSRLENREYGRRESSRSPHGTLYSQKFSLTSPPSGGRSVGIVHLRTQATEFVVCLFHEPKSAVFFLVASVTGPTVHVFVIT